VRAKLSEIPVDEFIRRFLIHVLPRGFQRIRFFGSLSNRKRKVTLATCRRLLAGPRADLLPDPADYRTLRLPADPGIDPSLPPLRQRRDGTDSILQRGHPAPPCGRSGWHRLPGPARGSVRGSAGKRGRLSKNACQFEDWSVQRALPLLCRAFKAQPVQGALGGTD
jgi:hypothetical protein